MTVSSNDIRNLINETLNISEAHELPDAMMNRLFNDPTDMFEKFLTLEPDLSHDLFTGYFQEQHANREAMMQDFTPKEITGLLPKLAVKPYESCLDVCAGTGGLSISVLADNPNCEMYCIELSKRALPILLFNLMIRNASGYVLNGDVLEDKYEAVYKLEKGEKFSSVHLIDAVPDPEYKVDLCVTNPPYSLAHKWSKDVIDHRFARYGYMSNQYNDLTFVLHGLYHLKESGELFAILPHGVLFRERQEATIRKSLVDAGNLYAVIGLPEALFQNTQIPTCIMVLKKRSEGGTVLLMNAEKEYEKQKKYNVLTENGINKIVRTYHFRSSADRFASLVPYDKIKENGCDLNLVRYICTVEPKKVKPLGEIAEDLKRIDQERTEDVNYLADMLTQLTGSDSDIEQIQSFGAWLKSRAEQQTDYDRLTDVPPAETYRIRLTSIGSIGRAKAGTIYPAGTIYIRVSACSRNDTDKWQLLKEPQELESKYAVFIPDSDIKDDPLFICAMLEAGADEFYRKYVGKAINISVPVFNYYEMPYIFDDDVKQDFTLRLYEIESLKEQAEKTEKELKNAKAWFMDKMFPHD